MTIQRKATKKAAKKKVVKRKRNPDSINFQSVVGKKVVLVLKYHDSNTVVYGILEEYHTRGYDYCVQVDGYGGSVCISSENMRLNKTTVGSKGPDRDTAPKYQISNDDSPSLWDY